MARKSGFSEVRLSSKELGKLLVSDEVKAALEAKAQPILERAQAIAPVDTGEYKASLHLEHDITDRAVVRIASDDDAALAIEALYATLGVALEMSRDD